MTTTVETTTELDPAKQEAFAGRMVETLNAGALALMVGLGHDTGLFETLASLPPSTSDDVARAAGLDERYVREWLGGMTASGVVEYDPATRSYRLPPEHACFLTPAAGPDNLAVMLRYVALLGRAEPIVREAFRNGGGAPYSAFPDFQGMQAEETGPLYDAILVDAVLPMYPQLRSRLDEGADVAEIGSGQGHALCILATAYPRSRFTGIDISVEGVAAGNAEARQRGLSNVSFQVGDAAEVSGEYDVVCAFDVIHDLARPTDALAAIRGALRPGGVFFMVDIAASSNVEDNIEHPIGTALYGFSIFYCMTTSLAQGGEGLGTVWGEQLATTKMTEAGFTGVDVQHLEGDFFHAFFLATTD
jgi:SAM-dependent methyltransferase